MKTTNKILFLTDLDNTLIHSYRHKKQNDICVEWIDEKEQGFMSIKTYDLLPKIFNDIILIPITTRSIKQYKRIKWPKGCQPDYAITTNGGVLLNKDIADNNWILDTKDFTKKYKDELEQLYNHFSVQKDILKCEIIDDTYLFFNCKNEMVANRYLEQYINKTNLEIAVSNRKGYFLPPGINKGMALKRINKLFENNKIICAGDSVLDIPMLELANISIVPNNDIANKINNKNTIVCNENNHFSDFILDVILKEINKL